MTNEEKAVRKGLQTCHDYFLAQQVAKRGLKEEWDTHDFCKLAQ
jgi:hypothetical protein